MGQNRLLTMVAAAAALLTAAPAPGGVSVVTSAFPPYSYEEDGAVQGVATEIVRAALAEAGLDAAIQVRPWPRAYETALRVPGTLIYLIARTPEREAQFKWVGEVVSYDVHLYRRADRKDVAPAGVGDAARWRVGGLLRDVKTEHLEEHGVRVTPYADEANGLAMLLRGRIDLMPSDTYAMAYRLVAAGRNPAEVEPVLRLDAISRPLYLAAHRDTPDALVERLRAALARVHPDAKAGR